MQNVTVKASSLASPFSASNSHSLTDSSAVMDTSHDSSHLDSSSSNIVSSEDDGSLCQVCFNGDSLEDNPIVFCSGCDIGVHQFCYGVTDIPEGDWYCQRCEVGLTPEQAVCVLCPTRSGALRRCADGQRWAHVACALWTPETYLGVDPSLDPAHPIALGAIEGVDNINSARMTLRCEFCRKSREGPLLQVGSCFHLFVCKYGFLLSFALVADIIDL